MILTLSRSARRSVACITGVLFFLCQSAAIAQACLTMTPQPDATAVQQPCHAGGGQTDSTADGSQAGCQYVSPALSGFDIFATTDLPAITISIDETVHTASAVSFEPPLLRVEPPPHSILHCCLRN